MFRYASQATQELNYWCYHSPSIYWYLFRDTDDDDDDIPLAQLAKLSKELFNVSYKDLPSTDAELPTTDMRTTDWDLNARDIISQKSDSETSDCDETDVEDNDSQVCTFSDETSYMYEAKLKDYASRNGSAQILNHVNCLHFIGCQNSIKVLINHVLYQIQVTALLPFFRSILHLLLQLLKIMI